MVTGPYEKGQAGGGRRAWTLVELLIVVAIIAVLLGLLLPAIHKARDAASRVGCASALRQLALATHMYADVHQRLPPGCSYPFSRAADPSQFELGQSWQTSILPWVEQQALWSLAWEAHRQSPSGGTGAHAAVGVKVVPVFLCPSEGRRTSEAILDWPAWGLTTYAGVAGTSRRRNDGLLHPNLAVRFADITDGTSTTVLIGERPPGPKGLYGAWYSDWGCGPCALVQVLSAGATSWVPPEGIGCKLSLTSLRPGRPNDVCDVNHFWSFHSGGANFAFADGSVRFLPYARSEALPDLATRAGGEVATLD
jgi:prepilin-type processing-associated H-X9-DG protein/prepilin-type N-terminal cleavage/methylation domain-containing protein